MAPEHLWSARHLARLCGEIEERERGTRKINRPHRAYAIGAVFSSVAFIEAYINEVFQDIADSEPGKLNSRCMGISEQSAAILRELWAPPRNRSGGLEKASVLDKYCVSLTSCGKDAFDRGSQPYQRTKKLIGLRNALVHFKPETQSVDEAHKLEKALKSEFPHNQIYPDPVSPWYSIACLGCGCAEWSHATATALVDEWQKRMGLVRDYKDEMKEYDRP